MKRIKLLLAAAAAMAVLMVVSAAPAMAQAEFEVGDNEFEVEDAGTLCGVFSEVFPCTFFTVSDDSGGDSEFSSPGISFESGGGGQELEQNTSTPGTTLVGSLSSGGSFGGNVGGSGEVSGGGIDIG